MLLASAAVGFALGSVALWCRPETRLPAVAAWLVLGLCVYELSGDAALHFLFFVSTVIAAGSADYPYDD